MALLVRISARAASQIRRAADWWTTNRPAAPDAVRIDVGETLALLSQQPGIGAACQGTRTEGVRRVLVGRIRYCLCYRVTPTTLDVLAPWHASRGAAPNP